MTFGFLIAIFKNCHSVCNQIWLDFLTDDCPLLLITEFERKLYSVCLHGRVNPKVSQSLGPSLTLSSLFHPQLGCSQKVSEIGYCLMKLGIILQDLQDFILTKTLI